SSYSVPVTALSCVAPSLVASCRCYLALSSFPTRRSSDLFLFSCLFLFEFLVHHQAVVAAQQSHQQTSKRSKTLFRDPFSAAITRSEEHTSELQSRFDLVCRLLLEKTHNSP